MPVWRLARHVFNASEPIRDQLSRHLDEQQRHKSELGFAAATFIDISCEGQV